MAETDYKLLSIVAAIALLAILGMGYLSMTGAAIGLPETSITGNFVAEPAAPQALAPREGRVPLALVVDQSPDFDLNSDGTLDESDLAALIRALDTKCPAEKTCDFNGDLVFDVRDTAAMADALLDREAASAAPIEKPHTERKEARTTPSALA